MVTTTAHGRGLGRSDMTLDDQLRALAPLDPKQVGVLAGYSSRGDQLSAYRARGSKIPDDRLEELARGLELLAGIARSLKARQAA